MNKSQVLFAFLVCFVLCCLTLSQPVQQTSAQEWNQQINDTDSLAYNMYLIIVLGAASAGKNVFEHPDSVSSDCVRTVRVLLNSLYKPSISKATYKIVESGLTKASEDPATIRNPAQMICEKLNEAVKLSNQSWSDFQEQKNKVQLPKLEKSFLLEVPQGKNFTQYAKDVLQAHIQIEIEDAELLRYATMVHFNSKPEFQAALRLAKHNALKPIVDALFTQALDNYVEANPKKQMYLQDIDNEITYEDFRKLVDDTFMKNEQLKDEYKKVVEEERRTGQPPSEPTTQKPSDQKPSPSMKLGQFNNLKGKLNIIFYL